MTDWKKCTAKTAREVCNHFDIDLDPAAQAMLADDMAPQAFFQAVATEHPVEAAKFLAFCLPKREATWWACLCGRAALTVHLGPAEEAALDAADAWVFKPSEENRRAAMDRGTEADGGSAAAMAANAAAWSGGSLAPAELEVVPPAENLTGQAVGVAFVLAAHAGPPTDAPERMRLFLAQGADIAKGGNGRVSAEGHKLEGAT